MTRLVDEVDALHRRYVELVNNAVEADDLARAESLAESYDTDAAQLLAEREGLTHLLPLRRPGKPDSRLRALIRRLNRENAA